MSRLRRQTKETQIEVDVRIGSGRANVDVADGFLKHMVETLARYSGLDIELTATGDLKHHLIEDVAITLGLALADEVPASAARYGWAQIPMDEALADAAIDLGGRPFTWDRFRTNSTRTFCTPSPPTSARRCTSRCFAEMTRTTSSRQRSRRPAWRYGKPSSMAVWYSARRVR